MGLLENAQAAARLSYELYQTLVTLNTEVVAIVSNHSASAAYHFGPWRVSPAGSDTDQAVLFESSRRTLQDINAKCGRCGPTICCACWARASFLL